MSNFDDKKNDLSKEDNSSQKINNKKSKQDITPLDNLSEVVHKKTGRIERFARLSALTASVATRQISQRMKESFQDESEKEESRKSALSKSAQEIVKTLGQLKGAAMKVGQIMSTDPEILPPEFKEALASLQNDAPPMPFDVVKNEIENSFKKPLKSIYKSFSEKPIGAASIGQVHEAVLHTNEVVAVKIQYPGIRSSIKSDLKNLGTLFNLARGKVSKERIEQYIDEITNVMLKESDYLLEASMLERFLIIFKDFENVRSPKPYHEYSTTNILTMEKISGESLVNHVKNISESERSKLFSSLMHAYLTMFTKHNLIHADPHPGNYLVDQDGKIVLLDMGCIRSFDKSFINITTNFMKHVWELDAQKAYLELIKMGFPENKVDYEHIFEWIELGLEPLMSDYNFDFASWRFQEKGLVYFKRNPKIINFTPPREILFFLRTLAGLRGLLAQSKVKVNVCSIAKEYI